VSGGKDSTWQVVTCLQYGLHPLAVTWKTPARTDIGEARDQAGTDGVVVADDRRRLAAQGPPDAI